jgi:hypothetical protein
MLYLNLYIHESYMGLYCKNHYICVYHITLSSRSSRCLVYTGSTVEITAPNYDEIRPPRHANTRTHYRRMLLAVVKTPLMWSTFCKLGAYIQSLKAKKN